MSRLRTFPLCLCFLFFFPSLTVVAGSIRAAADAPVATAATPARASYTFPFTSLSYGAPVVQAKINDTVTATFLIDTGSSANAISQAIVDKLGLKHQIFPRVKIPSLLKGKETTYVALQKVMIGTLTLQGGAYIILPPKALDDGMKQEVDGILSMQRLRYFAITWTSSVTR